MAKVTPISSLNFHFRVSQELCLQHACASSPLALTCTISLSMRMFRVRLMYLLNECFISLSASCESSYELRSILVLFQSYYFGRQDNNSWDDTIICIIFVGKVGAAGGAGAGRALAADTVM